jgi:hypothetical protein
MKRLVFLVPIVLVLLIGLASINSLAASASPEVATYDLTWYTIDGGGATFSSGGSYLLSGTIGQFDAGGLSNGAYTLMAGFWSGLAQYNIYLPLVLKNS